MAFGQGRRGGGNRGGGRGGNRGGQAPKQLTGSNQGGVHKAGGGGRGRGGGGQRPQGRGGRGAGGRGRFNQRGRGGRFQQKKVPSQADLDEELDKYMLRDATYASKKLDDDLDDYFKAKKSDDGEGEQQAAEEQK